MQEQNVSIDPTVEVTSIAGDNSTWNISHNLSDRWGDLTYHNARAGKAVIEDGSELHERLQSQMYGEATFLARKDGQFGVLFELEFLSQESEEHAAARRGQPDLYADLKPHADMVGILVKGLNALAIKYPNVQFCVPDKKYITDDRPAVWAFAADGALSDEERDQLGTALFNL